MRRIFRRYRNGLPHKTVREFLEDEDKMNKYLKLGLRPKKVELLVDIITNFMTNGDVENSKYKQIKNSQDVKETRTLSKTKEESNQDLSLYQAVIRSLLSPEKMKNIFRRHRRALPHKTVRAFLDDKDKTDKYIKLGLPPKKVELLVDIITDFMTNRGIENFKYTQIKSSQDVKEAPSPSKAQEDDNQEISLYQAVIRSPLSPEKMKNIFRRHRRALPHKTVRTFLDDKNKVSKYLELGLPPGKVESLVHLVTEYSKNNSSDYLEPEINERVTVEDQTDDQIKKDFLSSILAEFD